MSTLDNREYDLETLMTGRRFIVPEYQRYFAWEADHLDDLWNDLMNVVDRESTSTHFMGQIICREDRTVPHGEQGSLQQYELVDGQQRLTTLVLLLKCVADRADDSMDLDGLRTRYLWDPGIKDTTPQKVQLQSDTIDDNRVLRAILADDDGIETRTASEQRLVAARNLFQERIDTAVSERGTAFLEDLIDLVSRLQIMIYNVQSEEKAALIYETINDRGKQLTSLEKTKSFLMHQTALCTDDDDTREERIRTIKSHFSGIYVALQDIRNVELADTIDNLVVDEDGLQQQHFISYVDEDTYMQYDGMDTDQGRTAVWDDYLGLLKWAFEHHREHSEQDTWDEIQAYSEDLSDFFQTYRYLLVDDTDPLAANLSDIFDIGSPTTILPLMVRSAQQDMDEDQAQELVNVLQRYMYSMHGLGNKRRASSRDRFFDLAYQLQSGESSIEDVIARIK